VAETIVIGTKVDLKGLKKGEKEITGSVDKMNDKFGGDGASAVSSFGESLTTMAGSATVAIAAIAGLTAGVVAYTKAQVTMATELKRVADNANIANEAVSGIATTFLSAGGDIDMASDFIQDFTERLGDAKAGSGSLQEAFNELGVDINGSTESALRQTISTLGTMDDRQRALFRGIELFGDTYKTVAQDISDGSDIMQNGMFSSEFIENSHKLQRNIMSIKTTLQSATNDALEPFVAMMSEVIESFDDDQIALWGESIGLVFTGILKAGALFGKGFNDIFSLVDAAITDSIASTFSLVRGFSSFIAKEAESLATVIEFMGGDASGLKETASNIREFEALMIGANQASKDSVDESILAWERRNISIQNYILGIETATDKTEENTEATSESTTAIVARVKEGASAIVTTASDTSEALRQIAISDKEAELLIRQQTEEAKKQLIMDGAQFAFDIGSSFFEMSISRDERELAQWKKNQNAKTSGLTA